MARLGDILVRKGFINQSQLEAALAAQGSERGLLGKILIRKELVTVEQLGEALEEQHGVPFHEIIPTAINPQVVRLLPEKLLRQNIAAPISISSGTMLLAMARPDDIETISEIEMITGYQVDPVVSMDGQIQTVLDQGFDDRIVARQTIVDMKIAELIAAEEIVEDSFTNTPIEEDEQAPVVRLVRSMLLGAINANTSDIHLEPHTPEMRVRYRVDGELQQVMTIPSHIEEAVVARIKVMADMDTTENRKPQDGHLSVTEGSHSTVNFRVSTIPTVSGQKVVLRLLDEGSRSFDLKTIGLCDKDLTRLQTLIDRPHGMIVVTGPTGSGKSTTMYTVLSQLNSVKRNIVTVEDPVEYRISGVNQVSADSEHGLGFANALKYIMRQDPDVIMVGEIRDHETAITSVQAALTGHLLISTLHTNDAVSAVTRLNDLGIDSFKIGGALLGSVAQRLLRTICEDCKEPTDPSEKMLHSLRKSNHPVPEDTIFYHGRGCKKCLGSGYSGRIPVFEIMVVTPRITDAIEKGLPVARIKEVAVSEGMTDLTTAGLVLAMQGKTTIEEVFYKVSN